MSSTNGSRTPTVRTQTVILSEWLSVDETMSYSGLNRVTLYKVLDQLDARKLGRRTLIRRSSIDKFMSRLPKVGPYGQRLTHLSLDAHAWRAQETSPRRRRAAA